MNYEIELSNDLIKYLKKLNRSTRNRILIHLNILSENPRHSELEIKKLYGYYNNYHYALVHIVLYIQ